MYTKYKIVNPDNNYVIVDGFKTQTAAKTYINKYRLDATHVQIVRYTTSVPHRYPTPK